MLRFAPLALVILAGGCSATLDFDGFAGADAGPSDSGSDTSSDAAGGDTGAADAGCNCVCATDSCGADGECLPAVVIARVATGSGHACALTEDGLVYCWGRNANGQLGDGTTETSDVPLSLTLTSTARAVGAGGSHSCAILDDGAMCWGLNDRGQLGDDSNTQSESPVRVFAPKGMGALMDGLALGTAHTCATATGVRNLWCWGRGSEGQIGNGNGTSVDIPVRVPSDEYQVVAAGYRHTCAIDAARELRCWGSDADAQLGNGPGGDTDSPEVVTDGRSYADVAAGVEHTCAVTRSGDLQCWGRGTAGQLGRPASGPVVDAPQLVGADTDWASVAAGDAHTCATKLDGRAFCFGSNLRGALGLGNTSPVDGPTEVIGGAEWMQLAGGDEFTCGVDGSGRLFCWGQNDIGQLGLGHRQERTEPTRVCVGDL